jgi:hypothetical protein
MQDLEPMDPLTSHPNPKSFCGCAKWTWMVEKQWFGCQADWTPGFWLKKDILQAGFFDIQQLTNINFKEDLRPMDPLPSHPKSFCGCVRWTWMVEKQWFGCHADWTHGFWVKKDILQQAVFLTSKNWQIPTLLETLIQWIPFPAIQNHSRLDKLKPDPQNLAPLYGTHFFRARIIDADLKTHTNHVLNVGSTVDLHVL